MPEYVDREARDRAAQITNDQFEDLYYQIRKATRDRAVLAVEGAVWGAYSDLHEHTLPPMPREVEELLRRCLLFPRRGHPYVWQRADLRGVRGTMWLVHTVVWLAETISRRTPEPVGRRRGPNSMEEWNYWPFASSTELANAEVMPAPADIP